MNTAQLLIHINKKYGRGTMDKALELFNYDHDRFFDYFYYVFDDYSILKESETFIDLEEVDSWDYNADMNDWLEVKEG